jgi:hypothetical protein
VFDGFEHPDGKSFVEWLDTIGTPTFILSLTAPQNVIKDRYCKKNELDELPEEQEAAFKEASEKALKCMEDMKVAISAKLARINFIKLDTGCSE